MQDIALGASACTCDAAGSEVVGRAVLERGLGCAQSRDLEGGVLVPSTHSSGLLPSRGGRGKLAPAGEEGRGRVKEKWGTLNHKGNLCHSFHIPGFLSRWLLRKEEERAGHGGES